MRLAGNRDSWWGGKREVEFGRRARRRALEYIANDPLRFLALSRKKLYECYHSDETGPRYSLHVKGEALRKRLAVGTWQALGLGVALLPLRGGRLGGGPPGRSPREQLPRDAEGIDE